MLLNTEVQLRMRAANTIHEQQCEFDTREFGGTILKLHLHKYYSQSHSKVSVRRRWILPETVATAPTREVNAVLMNVNTEDEDRRPEFGKSNL